MESKNSMADKWKEREKVNQILEKYKDVPLPDQGTDNPADPGTPEDRWMEPMQLDISEKVRETVHKKKKAKRTGIFLTILSVLLIGAGIGVALYPTASQAYYNYKQEKLQEELKKVVYEYMRQAREDNLTQAPEPTEPVVSQPENPVTAGEEPSPTPFDYALIPVEENDDETQEASASATKSLLEGQTLFGSIEIQSMNLFYAIVEGTTKENLAAGIGHMTMTAQIGEVGNCAIAGHRGGITGKYFKHIDQLKIGDTITLMNIHGDSFDYIVYESFLVEPNEVWVIKDTGDGTRMLTLITCENNGKQRLIVRARMEE